METTGIIRPLSKQEQSTLVDWAGKEGWNPGLEDAELFWKVDPEGFLGIEFDGIFIGGGAIVKHNPTFGFMGLFIIHPDYRSKKLGTKLWYARRDQLLCRLNPGATIGLDAVDSMVPFYSRGGFVPLTRQVRYEWTANASPMDESSRIKPLEHFSFATLEKFDRDCFPGPRSEYLRLWTQQTGAHSLAIEKNDELRGFGVMRRCMLGWKIGPLFADSVSEAKELLMAFGKRAEGCPIFVDTPQLNPDAIALCQTLGMREVFGCVRMYLGPAPALMNHKIFSITCFEIG